MQKFYTKCLLWIRKHELPIIFIIIAILTIAGSVYIGRLHSISIINTSIIVSFISLAGVVFSYFYNQIMTRRIKLHSEAQWRPRLYNLMEKKIITYNDVLYFTAFFNVHKHNQNDIDIAIRHALEGILDDDNDNDNNNDDFKLNTKLTTLYNASNNTSQSDNLLKKINDRPLNRKLKDEHVILFKACISELLKADWDKQK